MTQGDPISLKIFNIVVDAVFRADILELCGRQESHHRFGWAVVEHKICFYADDRRIAGRNPFWVKISLTAMVIMFERVGLQTNLIKTKPIVCTPGLIWGQQGVEAYKKGDIGEVPAFWERKRTRVSCDECRGGMSASSL